MSVVRLGSHKAMREVVGSVLGQEKEPPTNKNEFLLERHKGGRNFLGRRSTRVKNKKMKGKSEVEGVGSPLGVTWRLKGVKAQERGPHSSHKIN
jgi:hypothetical protein